MKNTSLVRVLKKLFKWFLPVGIIGLAALLIAPMDYYLFDLLQSFAMVAMLAYFLFAVVLLFNNRTRAGLACLAAFLMLLAFLNPFLSPQSNFLADSVDLKVAHFNVFQFNTQLEETIETAQGTQADFLSFQEVSMGSGEILVDNLSTEYPYFHIQDTGHCCYGLAVFSKYPIENLNTLWWQGIPNITGNLSVGDTSIHFIASHTPSPTSLGGFKKRNRHIARIKNYLADIEGPTLAIGDLNAVPWNKQLMDLKEETGMIDSRKGVHPTFPSWLWFLQVPIDYILHSDELGCIQFSTVKAAGSDHYGIVGTYELREKG